MIVLADENARSLLDGFGQGAVPPQYQGGIGRLGVGALDQFVSDGGTLVCLNGSSNFAITQLQAAGEECQRRNSGGSSSSRADRCCR